jgi:uncharacterized phage protein gp47/JayE
LTALRDRVAADFNGAIAGADSRLRRSALGGIGKMHAGAMNAAYGALDAAADVLPDTKREDVALRWAAILAVARKSATSATRPVTLTGDNGYSVDAGTVLTRTDGVRYLTQASATISAGVAAVDVAAETPGTAGSLITGQQLTFASPVPHIAAIATVAAGGSDGTDDESIESLQARYLAVFRNRPAGGTDADWERWALEVAGVTRAWVTANVSGLGTVGIQFVIDGREDIIPTSPEVAAVAAYLDAFRPICAELVVTAPTPDALDFEIALDPDTSAIRTAVIAELRDLLAREAEPGGTIKLTHIQEAISIAAGEDDHVLVSPSANATHSAGHIAVLGDFTWS